MGVLNYLDTPLAYNNTGRCRWRQNLFRPWKFVSIKGALPMLEHQDKLNSNATAFIRAFSDLIKDSTSHLATKDDIDTTNKNMQAQFARQEEKIAEIARKLD